MVPNFCVNLKPEKFHTVAHFKKKSSAPVWEVFCVSERRKKYSLVVSNCKLILDILSKAFFFFFFCAANLGVSTGFPVCARNSGMPRVTFVTCQLPETPWNLSEHLLHIKTKCSFLPVSPGALLWGLKPSQAYLKLVVLSGFYTHTHTHTHTHLYLSAILCITHILKSWRNANFYSAKKEKNAKVFRSLKFMTKYRQSASSSCLFLEPRVPRKVKWRSVRAKGVCGPGYCGVMTRGCCGLKRTWIWPLCSGKMKAGC